MHSYSALVKWERGDAVFTDRLYSRAHEVCFIARSVKTKITVAA